MKTDAERSVRVIEKDLDSLLVHYKFEKRFWRTLRTTNPIERVNKELKRRTTSMETLGERTLEVLVAFTAVRLAYPWFRGAVDSSHLEILGSSRRNEIEEAVLQLIH